jgi:hypothetical protein
VQVDGSAVPHRPEKMMQKVPGKGAFDLRAKKGNLIRKPTPALVVTKSHFTDHAGIPPRALQKAHGAKAHSAGTLKGSGKGKSHSRREARKLLPVCVENDHIKSRILLLLLFPKERILDPCAAGPSAKENGQKNRMLLKIKLSPILNHRPKPKKSG